jgi:hypothetical protein
MRKINVVIAMVILMMLGITASVFADQVSGTITTWQKGSTMSAPVEKPLPGATIIIGKDLWLDVGKAGTDTVKGQVIAKTTTDSAGNFMVNVPPGKYSMIIWKVKHTPSTITINSPGRAVTSINYDNYTTLHMNLGFQK